MICKGRFDRETDPGADDLRRRCHEMVDRLTDPDLIDRARRFLAYLYIPREKEPPRCCEHRDGQSGI